MKIGLSIQSGWNLGGPGVTLEDKAKQIAWSEIQVKGGRVVSEKLPIPKSNYDYYRDICVLAWPTKMSEHLPSTTRQPIRDLIAKSGPSPSDKRYL